MQANCHLPENALFHTSVGPIAGAERQRGQPIPPLLSIISIIH